MRLVYSKGNENVREMWFIIIIYYDCIIIINILIINDATTVLFIVTSELTQCRYISQRYYVIVYISVQKNPFICKRNKSSRDDLSYFVFSISTQLF